MDPIKVGDRTISIEEITMINNRNLAGMVKRNNRIKQWLRNRGWCEHRIAYLFRNSPPFLPMAVQSMRGLPNCCFGEPCDGAKGFDFDFVMPWDAELPQKLFKEGYLKSPDEMEKPRRRRRRRNQPKGSTTSG